MSKRDYYETLGVSKSADSKAIKAAFRKLAVKYHPDRNPDDKSAEDKFKEINEAYEVLSNEEKRTAYDRYGHSAFEGGGGGRSGFGGSGFSDFGDLGDIFGDIFGGGFGGGSQSRSSAMRGADLRYNMTINLEDAFYGKEETIEVNIASSCDSCKGTGSEDGKTSTCGTCHGSGTVRQQRGFFTMQSTCPQCQGRGTVISNPCKSCKGETRINKLRKININIPKGIEDGTQMRVSGKGEAGVMGGPAGDLYVFIRIRKHRLFERDGANLYFNASIPMTTAALGGNIVIPTIEGKKLRINIKAGTQSDDELKLSSKGMPILRSREHGSLYVSVKVETPVNLSEEQKAILNKFAETIYNKDSKNHPESDSFLDKIKSFFK